MFDSNNDITTLNSLIATTLDSADGYTEAAKESDNPKFGDMFTSRASERSWARSAPGRTKPSCTSTSTMPSVSFSRRQARKRR
mgnify:CR=1 FL=1